MRSMDIPLGRRACLFPSRRLLPERSVSDALKEGGLKPARNFDQLIDVCEDAKSLFGLNLKTAVDCLFVDITNCN